MGFVLDDLGDEGEGGIGDVGLGGLGGGGCGGWFGGEEGGEDLEGVDHTAGALDIEVVGGDAGEEV